eukprot:258718-Chlamydomonas_euryale.AAC.2
MGPRGHHPRTQNSFRCLAAPPSFPFGLCQSGVAPLMTPLAPPQQPHLVMRAPTLAPPQQPHMVTISDVLRPLDLFFGSVHNEMFCAGTCPLDRGSF